MATEGVERKKKYKLNIGNAPRGIREDMQSEGLRELRSLAENKVKELDEKIKIYVEDLMILLLPTDATELERKKLMQLLSVSIQLDIYRGKIETLYYHMANERKGRPNYLTISEYIDTFIEEWELEKTQRVLTNKEPNRVLTSPSGEKKYQRRFTVEPNSPDLHYMKEDRLVREEFNQSLQVLSAKNVKRYMENYPYIKTVVELRDFIFNGGNLETLSLESSLYDSASRHVEALRRILIEKTMISLGQMQDYIEYRGKNLFNINEYLHTVYRYMNGSEKIRRVVGYANQELEYEKTTADERAAISLFQSTVALNDKRLSGVSNNPLAIRRVVNEIIDDAAIDLSPIGDREAIKDFKRKATEYVRMNIEERNAQRNQRTRSSYSGSDELTDNQKGAIAGAALLATYGFMILYAINSPEAQALLKTNDTSVEHQTHSSEKIVGQVDERTNPFVNIGTSDGVDVAIPGIDGEEIILRITDESVTVMQNVIEENNEENEVAEQERQEEQYIPEVPETSKTPYTPKHARMAETAYIPAHARKGERHDGEVDGEGIDDGSQNQDEPNNITPEQNNGKYQRRRRADRYKENHEI